MPEKIAAFNAETFARWTYPEPKKLTLKKFRHKPLIMFCMSIPLRCCTDNLSYYFFAHTVVYEMLH